VEVVFFSVSFFFLLVEVEVESFSFFY